MGENQEKTNSWEIPALCVISTVCLQLSKHNLADYRVCCACEERGLSLTYDCICVQCYVYLVREQSLICHKASSRSKLLFTCGVAQGDMPTLVLSAIVALPSAGRAASQGHAI